MRVIPRDKTSIHWLNLFSVPTLAIVSGFALYHSCGPLPGKIILYFVDGLLGALGLVSNFSALMELLPDSPTHGHGHAR